jgi:hypothetical protein
LFSGSDKLLLLDDTFDRGFEVDFFIAGEGAFFLALDEEEEEDVDLVGVGRLRCSFFGTLSDVELCDDEVDGLGCG